MQQQLLQRIGLPALCLSLASLTLFLLALEPKFRRTFFMRDSRHSFCSCAFQQTEKHPQADADRARICTGGGLRYVGPQFGEWVRENAAEWDQSPPAWYTVAWRDDMRSQAELLGRCGPAVLALLRNDELCDDSNLSHRENCTRSCSM